MPLEITRGTVLIAATVILSTRHHILVSLCLINESYILTFQSDSIPQFIDHAIRNISSSGLTGEIVPSISNLTMIQYL